MNKTSIPWTERTWNPMHGCTKWSEGCKHCYAETMARRLKGMGVKTYENGFQPTLNPDALDEPKKIKKATMFFVCSMGDLFHRAVPFEYIDRVMETIENTPQHTYQILTKRDLRMHDYFVCHRNGNVPKNVWLGVSIENRLQVLRTVPRGGCPFLCIEMKTKQGRQSDTQKAYQQAVEGVGARYEVVRTAEEFINVINDYLKK